MITKEQHEEIITDVDSFNRFVSDLIETVMQRVIVEIPNMVMYHIKEVQNNEKLRKEFYDNNPKLKNNPEIITQALSSIVTQHPDWNREKVYKETAVKANQLIEMESTNGQGF
jgi:hypothetical protein